MEVVVVYYVQTLTEMNFNKELLERYFAGLCETDELLSVRKWFATSEGQRYLLTDMDKKVGEKVEGNEFEGMDDVRSALMYEGIERKLRCKDGWRLCGRIAMGVIPLLILNALLWFLPGREKQENVAVWHEVHVAKGEQLQVLLQDGTKVWLNADSRFSYPDNFNNGERQVKLEGEAYFQVEKNEQKPFLVELNGMDIRVIGTSFNVRAYAEDSLILTSLDEGAIELCDGVSAQKGLYKVVPGQVALFSKNDGVCEINDTKDMSRYSAWKSDCLMFRKSSLLEVLRVLERKYDKCFEVVDKRVLDYTYTFIFRHMTLNEVIEGMELIAPVRFMNEDGVYKIYYTK